MKTTVGVFNTHLEAEHALNKLKEMGVDSKDLSYIYSDMKGDMHDDVSKVGTDAAKGATTGAVIGALAGLIVANGILPGIGTLFVAGPLAASLGLTGAVAAGVATGIAAGGIIGALAGLGINNEDATLYENLVKKGDVLVVARTDHDVKHVFTEGGAEEIREYAVV